MEVSWGQPQVGTCSHLIVMCADTEVGKLIDRLEKSLSKTDMPAESVQAYVKMMRDFAGRMGNEQKLSWAQKQVYIALGNALNGAKALGLDSCPMEGFDAKKCAEILGLPSNIVPTLLCPVGYAADKPRGKMRFAKKDVFF
jgi:nitroreductase